MQVTKVQLADLLGVNGSSLPRLVGQGMPGPTAAGGGRGKAAMFDAVRCLAWQREQWTAGPTGASARDEYLQALTEKARLDVAERQGELISADEAERQFVAVATTVKARLRALPASIAVQVVEASAGGPASVAGLLLAKIDDVLRELAAAGRRLQAGEAIDD
jgi:phage terminase Nu1 subunit (DNA packaging protein)